MAAVFGPDCPEVELPSGEMQMLRRSHRGFHRYRGLFDFALVTPCPHDYSAVPEAGEKAENRRFRVVFGTAVER